MSILKLLKILVFRLVVRFLDSCMVPLGLSGVIVLSTLSCAGVNKKLEEPVSLELKGGFPVEKSVVTSRTNSKTFLNGKIRHERFEEVVFLLESKLRAKTQDGVLTFETTTLEKDGFGNLNDMAFPELDEKLSISYDRRAKVVQAGQYPKHSIFYVPPVSLPEAEVKVGDTWTMQSEWMSTTNNIPLKLNVVTIFKEATRCEGGFCAKLEVSGAVEFVAENMQRLNFKNEITGFILFHVEQGRILDSEIHSQESFLSGETEVVVSSCLKSVSFVEKQRKPKEPSCQLK